MIGRVRTARAAIVGRIGALVVVSGWLFAAIATNCCRPGDGPPPLPPGIEAEEAPRGTPIRSSPPATEPAPVPPTETQAPPAPSGVPVPAATQPAVKKDEILKTTMDVLSNFKYEPPKAQYDEDLKLLPITPWPDTVPQAIKDLEGRRISVEGYVIPLDYQDESYSKFILAAFLPSCCFGDTIRPNQWIKMETKDGKRVPYKRGLHRGVGVLEIVPHESAEALTELYHMKAESVSILE